MIILATAVPPAPSSARKPRFWRCSVATRRVGFLRQMPEPVLDIRDEPSGATRSDGMVVVQRWITRVRRSAIVRSRHHILPLAG
jgi:hypothetical protein